MLIAETVPDLVFSLVICLFLVFWCQIRLFSYFVLSNGCLFNSVVYDLVVKLQRFCRKKETVLYWYDISKLNRCIINK